MEPADLAETTLEHFDRHFAVNVRRALFSMQAAMPLMPPSGAALSIGSIAFVRGATLYGSYAATERCCAPMSELDGRTRASRRAYEHHEPQPDRDCHDGRNPEKVRGVIVGHTAARMARAAEVAAAALFCSATKQASKPVRCCRSMAAWSRCTGRKSSLAVKAYPA